MLPRINPQLHLRRHRRLPAAGRHLADEHELQTRAPGRSFFFFFFALPPNGHPREGVDLLDDASDAQARFLEDFSRKAVQEGCVGGFDVAAGDGEEVGEGGVVGGAF
ncbi:MAG: hypothetical protein ASARMPREDX12_007833 [Alectoria sarmentosa]|nr:MAG: hypothetical protein ASARMPREDX12_007833 [Alectoria sarmentosa]